MSKQPKPAPTFASEAEEREFWETHDSTEHVDWSQVRSAVLPSLKPSPDGTGPALAPAGPT